MTSGELGLCASKRRDLLKPIAIPIFVLVARPPLVSFWDELLARAKRRGMCGMRHVC